MNTTITSINFFAVILAAVVGVFGLGGFWYTLFGALWNKEAGISPDEKKGHPALVYSSSLLMGMVSATTFALFIGANPELLHAVLSGLLVGSCFVATSFAINYSFGGRSIKLFAIDAAYHIMQFAVYGVVLGLWH